jgi:hypothetical protein
MRKALDLSLKVAAAESGKSVDTLCALESAPGYPESQTVGTVLAVQRVYERRGAVLLPEGGFAIHPLIAAE